MSNSIEEIRKLWYEMNKQNGEREEYDAENFDDDDADCIILSD